MKRLLTGMALATGIAAVAIPASGQPLPTQEFPYKSGPVTITSCTLNENKSNSTVSPNSLRINYFDNLDGSKITSITFRVRYGGTPVTLTDTGSFDYRQSITHQFNLLGGQPWSGSSPQVCRVLTATLADGRVVNPPYDGPDGQAENAPPPLPPAGAPPAALPPPAVVPPPAPAPAAT